MTYLKCIVVLTLWCNAIRNTQQHIRNTQQHIRTCLIVLTLWCQVVHYFSTFNETLEHFNDIQRFSKKPRVLLLFILFFNQLNNSRTHATHELTLLTILTNSRYSLYSTYLRTAPYQPPHERGSGKKKIHRRQVECRYGTTTKSMYVQLIYS